MSTVFEFSTINYADDVLELKKAMSHLETLCGAPGGYALSEPITRFGWTFFKIKLKLNLRMGIEEKFFDMLQRYPKGEQQEKLVKFMSDFLESKGCKFKVKLLEY